MNTVERPVRWLELYLAGKSSQIAGAVVRLIGGWGCKRLDRLTGTISKVAMRQTPAAARARALPAAELGKVVRSSPPARALIAGRTESTTPGELLALADDRPFRTYAAFAIASHWDIDKRNILLHQTLALSGGSTSQNVAIAAMLATERGAAQLETIRAKPILRRMLLLSRQPVNPYDQPGIIAAARTTAISILREHPTLDQLIVDELDAGHGRSATDLYAVALRGRPHGRAAAVTRFIKTWQPDEPELKRFARTADSGARAEILGSSPLGQRLKLRRSLVAAFTAIVGILFVGMTAVTAWSWHWAAPPIEVDTTTTLAAIAVLVTVHVVTAELAAGRLAGLVARYTSAPPALRMAYLAATAALISSVATASTHGRAKVTWAWTSLAATATLLVATVAVMVAVVRRTDAATAVESYVQTCRGALRRAGRQVGRAQSASVTGAAAVATSPAAQTAMVLSTTERRVVLSTSGRGFLSVRLQALHRLAGRAGWSDGRFRLQVLGQLGTIVSAGERIGLVIPDEDGQPGPEVPRARRVLRISSSAAAEKAAEVAAIIVGTAADRAAEGDVGGAERAGRSLEELLLSHLGGVRSEAPSSDVPLPVVPAVRSAVGAIAGRYEGARNRLERQTLLDLGMVVLRATNAQDYAAFMLVDQLARRSRSHRGDWEQIMWASCTEMIVAEDRSSLLLSLNELARGLKAEREPTGHLATDLASFACSVDPNSARRIWAWIRDNALTLSPGNLGLVWAARIGASALRAGLMSLAIEICVEAAVPQMDLAWLGQWLDDPEVRDGLQLRSDLHGGSLGPSAADAINDWQHLATEISALSWT